MLSLITGPFGKIIGYGALIVSLGGALGYAKHTYDASIIAGIAAKNAAALLITTQADNARVVATLQARVNQAQADAASKATIIEAISHAKRSSACIGSAPMRAALDGLRGNVSSH